MSKARPGLHEDRSMRAMDHAFTSGRFMVVLILLVAALFPDVLTSGSSFFYRDFGLFGYPLATEHQRAFWDGELPMWNPYSSCGMPFLAQWNTMVFYPGSLIYLLLPLPWSLNLFCLAHLVLAGLSMYGLAHAWTRTRLAATVAGFAFAFNGLMLHCLMWPNNMAALAWMPLVMLCVERAWRRGGRWLGKAAMVAALQFLSGGPEILLFTWAILGAWWGVHLCHRLARMGWQRSQVLQRSGRLAVVGCLLAGLTAMQLWPFLRFLARSHRDAGFGDSMWSMPGWGWANFLVPLFHATPSVAGVFSQDDQQWTSSYYMGVGVLLLGVLALVSGRSRPRLRVWFLGGVLLAGLMLTLGDEGRVYAWLRTAFPALGFARFPVKFVVLVVWSLPLLAAFGVRSLVRSAETESTKTTQKVVGIAVGLVLMIAALVWFVRRYPFPGEQIGITTTSGLTRAGILVLVAVLLASLVRYRSGPLYLAAAGLLCAMVVIDGVTHTPRQNPTVSAQALQPRPATAHTLPGLGQGRAMLSPRMRGIMSHAGHPDPEQHTRGYRKVVCPNWNLVDRVPLVDGFFSLYPRRWQEVWAVLYGRSDGSYPETLADFLGVTRVTSDVELFAWEARGTALPLVTGGQQPVFLEESALLARLGSAEFRPRDEVLLPVSAREALSKPGVGNVQVVSFEMNPQDLEIVVAAARPSLVVVAQTHDPGWTCQVNGQPQPIHVANHAFQAVVVPTGRSTIRLAYRDQGVRLGLMVASCSWVGCLAGCANRFRKRAS